jgi:DNA repair exonuclease SbcCD nuclease subunit
LENLVNSHVLLFSDLHCHPHKKKAERLNDCLKALEWVFDVADEREINDLIFAGDLLHDRQRIDVLTYTKTWEILKRRMSSGVAKRLWLLVGNHDLWFNNKWSVSSVQPLSSIPGITIIDSPQQRGIADSAFDFIPYTHDPLKAFEELGSRMEREKCYCIGHLAIDGAILNSAGTVSDVVIEHDGDMVVVDAGLFQGYKHTFLGHYHSAQQISPNVEYIGSPLELSFGEAHQAKWIIDLDTRTGEKEYIENTFSPKHLYLRPKDLERSVDLKNNFVCLITDDVSAVDVVQMKQELVENAGVATFQVRYLKKKAAEEERVIEDAKAILFKEDEMLERYIKEVGADGLTESKLLRFGKNCIQKKEVDITL